MGVLRSRTFISKGKNKRYKTCPKLEVKSNVTDKKHYIINPPFQNINCHTSIIIYLLTCEEELQKQILQDLIIEVSSGNSHDENALWMKIIVD